MSASDAARWDALKATLAELRGKFADLPPEELRAGIDRAVAMVPEADWLHKAWENARAQGVDRTTLDEIDPEIAAFRRGKLSRG